MIRLFVERRITTVMIFTAVCLLGVISLSRLPVDLMPDIEMPLLTVITPFSGASAPEVERLVTAGIEEAVSAVSGVSGIESTSIEGMSIVSVNFRWGTDMDMALIETKEKADLIKGQLPEHTGKSVVVKYDPSAEPVMIYSVSLKRGDSGALRRRVEREVVPRIERIKGVALAEVLGGEKREIAVNVDNARLYAHNLSIYEIAEAIEFANYSYPAGSIKGNEKEYPVRTSGEFRNPEDIRSVAVGYNDYGVPVYLSSVASVEDTVKEIRSVIRFNGTEAVALLIKKEPDKNTIETCGLVRDEIAALSERLKGEFVFTRIYDRSGFIRDSVRGVFYAAVFGGVIAFFVLLLFLKSLRPPLIIAATVPVSVTGTFLLMHTAGISVNSISLGGLAVGIGMMVDSAIVVLESVTGAKERMKSGSETEAAISGARDVAAPVAASVFTTVIVFIPVIFLSGMAGAVFRELSITVSFALLFSLATSLTLIPMLAGSGGDVSGSVKMKNPPGITGRAAIVSGRVMDALTRFYERIITRALERPGPVLMKGAAAFFAGIILFTVPERELMPAVDPGEFVIRVEMPGGTPLEESASFAGNLEKFIMGMPGVEYVFTKAGSDPDDNIAERISGRGADYAELRVFLKSGAGVSSAAVIDGIRNRFKAGEMTAVSFSVRDDITASLFLSGRDSVNIEVYGGEAEELMEAGRRVGDLLAGYEGIENISSTFDRRAPELVIDIDREKAAALGISVERTALTVSTSVKGDLCSRFKEEDDEADIRVRLREADRNSIDALKRIPVKTGEGVPAALSEFAEIRRAAGPGRILRKEQNRVNIISAGFPPGTFVDSGRIKDDLASLNFREGIEVRLADGSAMVRDTLSSLMYAMLLAVAFIYMLLASQFQSLKNPLIIMLSIPVTAPGVLLALALTGQSININSAIGMIMLCGIVVNNAIVLFDFIEKERRSGMDVNSAVIAAGKRRLRPILMTTLTTVCALVPIALGIGSGSELQQPLAVTVIGGLLFSTALTLIFIPVVYSAVNGGD